MGLVLFVVVAKSNKIKKCRKKKFKLRKETKIVSLHANISDTPFDQRSPRPTKEVVLNCHRQTDRHGDSMTESAQLGQFSEKRRRIKKWFCLASFCLYYYIAKSLHSLRNWQ